MLGDIFSEFLPHLFSCSMETAAAEMEIDTFPPIIGDESLFAFKTSMAPWTTSIPAGRWTTREPRYRRRLCNSAKKCKIGCVF